LAIVGTVKDFVKQEIRGYQVLFVPISWSATNLGLFLSSLPHLKSLNLKVPLPISALERALPHCPSSLTSLKLDATNASFYETPALIENLNCSLSLLRVAFKPNCDLTWAGDSDTRPDPACLIRMVTRHGATLTDLSFTRGVLLFPEFCTEQHSEQISEVAPNLVRFSHTNGYSDSFPN
jgi:hypothetical protein